MGKKSRRTKGHTADAKKAAKQEQRELDTLLDVLARGDGLENWSSPKLLQWLSILQQKLAKLSKLQATFPEVPPSEKEWQPRLDRLTKWLVEHGATGINDAVEICDAPGCGRGIRALKSLAVGDEFISVPREVFLSLSSPRLSARVRQVVAPLAQRMPSLALALAVALEALDGDSFFRPFLNAMPSHEEFSASFPTHFSSDLLHLLVPQDMPEGASHDVGLRFLRSVVGLRRQHARGYLLIRRLLAPLAASGSAPLLSWHVFQWAMCCVMSRQNAVPLRDNPEQNELALIPGWDMANHCTRTEQGEPLVFSTTFNNETQSLVASVPEQLQQGNMVHIFYGRRPNRELLLHQGFTEANNRCDSFPFVARQGEFRIQSEFPHISPQLLSALTDGSDNSKESILRVLTDVEASQCTSLEHDIERMSDASAAEKSLLSLLVSEKTVLRAARAVVENDDADLSAVTAAQAQGWPPAGSR